MELRKGLGGRILFPTTQKQGTQKGFCTWESPRALFSCTLKRTMNIQPVLLYTALCRLQSSLLVSSKPTKLSGWARTLQVQVGAPASIPQPACQIQWLCYQIQAQLLTVGKQYSEDKCRLERKGCSIQEASNPGRRRTPFQEPTPKILLNHEHFLKGESGSSSQLIIWGGGQSLRYLPRCADFLPMGWW